MRLTLGIGVVLSVISLGPAFSESDIGINSQELFEDCKSLNNVRQVSCMRYLKGIFEMLQILGVYQSASNNMSHAKNLSLFSICTEKSITLGQMRQIYVNWAEKNPIRWKDPEFNGALSAFQETFPCNVN